MYLILALIGYVVMCIAHLGGHFTVATLWFWLYPVIAVLLPIAWLLLCAIVLGALALLGLGAGALAGRISSWLRNR